MVASRKRPRPVGVLVVFPLEEKRALVVEASHREVSVNDVLLGLLGAHYHIPVVLSRRRPSQPARIDTLAVVLRMPDALKRAIQLDAVCRRTNMTDLVRRVVADALGLTIDLPKSRRRSPFGGGARRRRVA